MSAAAGSGLSAFEGRVFPGEIRLMWLTAAVRQTAARWE